MPTSKELIIALISLCGISIHLVFLSSTAFRGAALQAPLIAVLALGGAPLVFDLLRNLLRGKLGSDVLAGMSIVTSVFLEQYLAGAIVVLMLSGGQALEKYAGAKASSVLRAIARRMPNTAKRREQGELRDIDISQIRIGDILVVLPRAICPCDGIVIEGHGRMDESFLTGEPYEMSKAPGAQVISGAINAEDALAIRAIRLPVDSRYARIARVLEDTQNKKVFLRRLGDQLGGLYAFLTIAIAAAAWIYSGEAVRFLAVLVVATPCPLLIGIPVAIIGAISLSARRSIIIKDPSALERIPTCKKIILDKTGTLTHGTPMLSGTDVIDGVSEEECLQLAATLEQYSKHPLARALSDSARRRGMVLKNAIEVNEQAGLGLSGKADSRSILITSRKVAVNQKLKNVEKLPPPAAGLECLLALGDRATALFHFRDQPRQDTRTFIDHLRPRHSVQKVVIVSGDREEEVRYLAEQVGVREIHAGKSPEEKVAIVKEETKGGPTLFLGDGINDAPALLAATVGVAFGHHSEITSEAAGVVIMDTSLKKVDELLHISSRMRTIALQSAIGGMFLSTVGMCAAAAGFLSPVIGAIAQEVIDLLAVSNALRASRSPGELADL